MVLHEDVIMLRRKGQAALERLHGKTSRVLSAMKELGELDEKATRWTSADERRFKDLEAIITAKDNQ